MGPLKLFSVYPAFLLLLFAEIAIQQTGPSTLLWAGPAILVASVMIAWAAESAQYFVAQGFALAILAWLQTLPEFAVEAVLAWHQQVPLLMANLTGALRLLTGFGWPVIYLTAAYCKRRRDQRHLGKIQLHQHHSVEVIGLLVPLLYMGVIAAKGSLSIWDGVVLVTCYAAYLMVLSKLPPEDVGSIEDLEKIPRAIVMAPKTLRVGAIAGLFLVGGALIYASAEPFLGGLLAVAGLLGVPTFVFVQWMAPLVSEFPEMASTFYWARTVERAPVALMNMVSSNINQWTLLTAMLPVIYSMSKGAVTPIVFDQQQQTELLLTIAQATVGGTFLLNMELAWWEASVLFVLFAVPFANPAWATQVTWVYFAWAALELARSAFRGSAPPACQHFGIVWKRYVRA
jgi:cation:H+ antiporter